MTILETIIEKKRKEVAFAQETIPLKKLERSIFFNSPCVSLKQYLNRPQGSGIIAEFKRKSPSKGVINAYAEVESTTINYMQAGASGLSVLTDQDFFGGSNDDLTVARKFNFCPILRKDFIIHDYQIVEAKSIGADVILLIAAVLNSEDIKQLTQTAHDLGLEVMLELHEEKELEKVGPNNSLIGINNRNLKDFKVDFNKSLDMAKQLPEHAVKVAESGIQTPEQVDYLKTYGFKGFLMGETFMKSTDPGKKCREFIQALNQVDAKTLSHVD